MKFIRHHVQDLQTRRIFKGHGAAKIRLAYAVKTKNKSSASPGDYAITGNTTQEMGKVTTYRWLRVLEEGII